MPEHDRNDVLHAQKDAAEMMATTDPNRLPHVPIGATACSTPRCEGKNRCRPKTVPMIHGAFTSSGLPTSQERQVHGFESDQRVFLGFHSDMSATTTLALLVRKRLRSPPDALVAPVKCDFPWKRGYD